MVTEDFSDPKKLRPIEHLDMGRSSKDRDSRLPNDDNRPAEQVPLEEAFAFIVRLDPNVAIDTLDNVENCIVHNSLDELRASMAGADRCIQSKPVVMLSNGVQTSRDYLVTAVALHWRYAGKYVLSRAKCSYFSKTGTLHIEPVTQLEMHRIAFLPCVLSMPAQEALHVQGQFPVFIPSNEFAVGIPRMSLSRAETRLIEDVFAPAFTSSQAEQMTKTGGLNHSLMIRLPIRADLPLSHLITSKLAKCRQLSLDLADMTFSKVTVEATITLIHNSQDEALYLREEVSRYLIALSRRPDVLLELEVGVLRVYIELSRQSQSADEVASNISIVSNRICELDLSLIPVLFEFLAHSISSEKLTATFCFAVASSYDEPERCIRLAESMRKFADETSLALLLISLHKARPSWLRKPKLLRSFQPLLSSPILNALASHVGERTVSNIRSVVKITERFRDAVLAGDEGMALRIFRNEEELAGVDFLRWMNSLRSLSFELSRMALPVSDLRFPGIDNLLWKKIAAIRFFDREVITSMRVSGALDCRDDLNATALSIVGDNSMLNAIIAEKYAIGGLTPMSVVGGSVSEVFHNAAASTRNIGGVDGPLVSVIMTAYNPDLELMKASLDSIKAQTWNNIEVIVVDDASVGPAQSSMRELVASYSNVELIRVAVNSGPYIGRNLAIQKAQGEFIAIQDADDWSHPQRLAAQVRFLLNTPEARAVTTEHIRINRAGNVALESGFRVFGDGPMTSVFRTEVFQQIGGFAATRSRGDLEMRERVAAYYGYQANAALPLPMTLCLADSTTLSNSMRTQKVHHIKLFHNNVAKMPDMSSLFRDGIPLTIAHQVPVPIMLRAPHGKSFLK